MQIRPGELDAQLAKGLAPAYAIHGDEPLLALEAADAVRAAAKRQGFAEREVFEPGRSFDWSEFTHATASGSLFGARKLLELRLQGKPGAQGGAAIAGALERPSPDKVLLVTLPRVDRAAQGSTWFSALLSAGVVVDIWPIERQRLPSWIAERLGRQKQRAPREVLEFLAERVEGNLLAAHQELQKLALLAPAGELSLEVVQEAVAAVARYNPNDAAEALALGDVGRYARIIEGLRGEGEAVPFVLFVLSGALFAMQSRQQTGSLNRYFNKAMQRALEAGAARLKPRQLDEAIADCAEIDRAGKGVGAGADPWQLLLALGLKLADGSKG